MRLTVAVTLGMMAFFGVVSGAAAQRDASDRGGSRLESEELQNDIREERLKKPIAPQTAPNSSVDEKRKQKDKKK